MTTDSSVLARFAGLASATVSDALESVGLPAGQGGFKPLWGQPQLVGFASTVQLEPITSAPEHDGAHILTTAIAEAGPEDVMVVANAGRTDVSCWGGLVSLGASRRGIRGVVADGACRDVAEAREFDFPIYGKASVPVTARGRLQQASAGKAVKLGAVTVHPGDVVLADETGVAVIPRDHIDEVLDAALAIVAREAAIAADVRAGVPLPEAMLDARLAGRNGAH
jgi:regulator of RNase E activity RraA